FGCSARNTPGARRSISDWTVGGTLLAASTMARTHNAKTCQSVYSWAAFAKRGHGTRFACSKARRSVALRTRATLPIFFNLSPSRVASCRPAPRATAGKSVLLALALRALGLTHSDGCRTRLVRFVFARWTYLLHKGG